MRAWRLYDHTQPYVKVAGFNPLSGEGGLHAPARWHHVGTQLTYASSGPSLAILEVFIHLIQDAAVGADKYTIVEIDVPDIVSVEVLSYEQLAQLTTTAPAGLPEQFMRDFGSQWAAERRSLVLSVPSVVVPYERNILLNPLHHEFQYVGIVSSQRYRFDGRLDGAIARMLTQPPRRSDEEGLRPAT